MNCDSTEILKKDFCELTLEEWDWLACCYCLGELDYSACERFEQAIASFVPCQEALARWLEMEDILVAREAILGGINNPTLLSQVEAEESHYVGARTRLFSSQPAGRKSLKWTRFVFAATLFFLAVSSVGILVNKKDASKLAEATNQDTGRASEERQLVQAWLELVDEQFWIASEIAPLRFGTGPFDSSGGLLESELNQEFASDSPALESLDLVDEESDLTWMVEALSELEPSIDSMQVD